MPNSDPLALQRHLAVQQQLAGLQHTTVPAVAPYDNVRAIQEQLAAQQIQMPTAAPLSVNTASMVAPNQGGIFDAIGQFGVGQQQAQAERDRTAQQSITRQGVANRQLMKERLASAKQQKAAKSNATMYKAFMANPKKAKWVMEHHGDLSAGIAAGTVNVRDLQNAYAASLNNKESLAASEKSQMRILNKTAAFNNKLDNNKANKTINAILASHKGYNPPPYIEEARKGNPQYALKLLNDDIRSGSSANRMVNPKQLTHQVILNRKLGEWRPTSIREMTAVDARFGNPANNIFTDDELELVNSRVKELMNSANTPVVPRHLIAKAVDSLKQSTKYGTIIRSNVERGWVNVVGEDNQVHTINLRSVETDNDPEVERRATLVAKWAGNQKEAIGIVKKTMLLQAKQENGGLVDDLSWADKHSIIQFNLVNSAASKVKEVVDGLGDAAKKRQETKSHFNMLSDSLNRLSGFGGL